MNTKFYRYYQPNTLDLKDRRPDCVIRALSKFDGCTWAEAFDQLVPIARERQDILNTNGTIAALMERRGIETTPFYKHKMTVKEFARKHKTGTFLLDVRSGFGSHCVTVVDGVYYDTWDSGDKLIFRYWAK